MNAMTNANDTIVVKSHVGRDLLQSAGVFKHERLVVWEYVSNGLEYIDVGKNPVVKVRIDTKQKWISISDSGRGMTWEGLKNFFVMHAENIDRKMGKPGRGFFGTGKSAAFGIAEILRVTTVRSGKRSKLELRRSDVERIKTGEPIPVTTLEREVATDKDNGTFIEIDGIYLKKIDQASIIQYIERHIARWPSATVFVNNHQCEFAEPAVAAEHPFRPIDGPIKYALGDVELIIKVSKTPLDDDLQGIAIYSEGVWHETTLAGSDRKEFAQYIFGEIDVPRLTTHKSPIPAFDMSRQMRLNRSNELVQTLFAFIGINIEKVRRQLVAEEKKRRASVEAKKLAREASEIAKIINEDFNQYRTRLGRMRAKMAGGSDLYDEPLPGTDASQSLVLGEDEPVDMEDNVGGIGHGTNSSREGVEPPNLGPVVRPTDDETPLKGSKAKSESDRKKTGGGFSVDFRNIGEKESRAKYERDERTIYVNLDHPQLKAAIGVGGIEDVAFKRLAYEVAFTEYAVALAREMVFAQQYYDLDEPLIDVRETINRVSRASAGLYSV